MPILVQLGQCGNQIGAELTQQLFESGDRSQFFTEKRSGAYQVRSVLVDMEPKVLTEIVNKKKNYEYAQNNIISSSSGSGNNWDWVFWFTISNTLLHQWLTRKKPSKKSYGYSVHGEKQKDTIIRQCQRLADDENSTNDGFILTLALAGGTGSGLG